ncbi:ImmA/IrrE family metallo-endopeptidase [Corynebacterium lujinxingii]|uniref:ImmA/IrrE family metallo-endopeptidase n=1 Tax=Corynebacterium lujinxingii TaxID=2763010 RepID=A0A7H0JY60_9CORY|nr:ImmA/IrrE family metallo-endopeptidase [Corynebacterium lujinxingii]MBC3178327.1 ImmA/IrrE family metallo-endopeptidase [Corynebacterium lujinxingii]NNO10796.1 ImmA/IrrE family metallo-endopeptidase [Corynebacterium lujinxingii]QNP89976.1 ImmA/IrrE family metallo-endopeptidase [Corynebacterium lujinxingii]
MTDAVTQASVIARRMALARELAELSIAETTGSSPISPERLVAIEAGDDFPQSLDIAVVAESTGLPIGWFLEERPQLVASRKPAPEGGVSPAFDLALERLSVHVEQLVNEGIITPAAHQGFRLDVDHDVIARRAAEVRGWAGVGDEPIEDLSAFCERVGLLVFSQAFPGSPFEGAVTEIEREPGVEFGIALVDKCAGFLRSRFTLAHELGHWVYRTSFETGCGHGDVERAMNSFAAHLLMPRSFVERMETKHVGSRALAMAVSSQCGVSWSATLGHLANLGVISDKAYALEVERKPDSQEFQSAGFAIPMVKELDVVPPQYRSAVLSAYRQRKLTTGKTLEVLFESVVEEQLPERIPPRGRKAS